MSRDTKGAGLWNAPSYQVSGVPFVTSSLEIPANSAEPIVVEFPCVTKDFVVRNDGAATIRLGYSANGIKGIPNNNYITLDTGISFEGDYKIVRLYLLSDSASPGSGSVSAGLTGIRASELVTNWSGSILYGGGVG